MVDKLSKALEGLKNIQFTSSLGDSTISKKEKMFFCVLAADVMISLKSKNSQNLPVVIENMINLCDDKDSDVRMVADESLNRIITSLSQFDMLKVLVELHKIIKKNGPARCVRAALTRFSQLSHYIRPNKGKAHAQSLIPALIEITKRQEESIHETLASSLENIFKVLGVFIKDTSLKDFIKACLHNISSSNPVIRRSSAAAIITVVQYCRKPLIFNCFVLNSLLDGVVPICDDNTTELILGVLGCLRLLLPILVCVKNEEGITGSFGLRRKQDDSILSVNRLIQAYELCLHYTSSKDHNVVTAALETLNQILQNPPPQLESLLLSPAGLSRSYIHSIKENRLWSRSGSETSVVFSLSNMEESLLFDDVDITSQLSIGESELEQKGEDSDSLNLSENTFENQVNLDSDTESIATLDLPSKFLMRIETEEKETQDELESSRSISQDDLFSEDKTLQSNLIDIGNLTDSAVPLIYCARHLAASFLLDGVPNGIKSDRNVRVSIKSLALSCLSAVVKLYPDVMKMSLNKNPNSLPCQEISDVLLFAQHSDPQIRGNICLLTGSFINSALIESKHFQSVWLDGDVVKFNINRLIQIILEGIQDKSSVCVRQALTALKFCIERGLFSAYNVQFLLLLDYLPVLAHNSYWLVKVKLVEVISDLSYVCINYLKQSKDFQEEVIDSVLLFLLGDEDARVRTAAAEALVRVIPFVTYGRSYILEYGKGFLNNFDHLKTSEGLFSLSDKSVEITLSLVVSKLSCYIAAPKNKYFLFGYLEALNLLAQKYPPASYAKEWNCESLDFSEPSCYLSSNLMFVVLSLFSIPVFALDLAAFSNGTLLLSNLFAGHTLSILKKKNKSSLDSLDETSKLWTTFDNECVSFIAEELLTHLLKILNFYSRLVDEVTLSSVAESSNAASIFFPVLSPVKKQDKKQEEKPDEKKNKVLASTSRSTQYVKLQQMLKNAYTNYKVSLDVAVGEKFLGLLESTLSGLSVLLEFATIKETGRCADELLSYFQSVVSLRPKETVICVIQLLKSLFGTNLVVDGEDKKMSAQSFTFQNIHLFEIFFHLPTKFFSALKKFATTMKKLLSNTNVFIPDNIRQRSNPNSLDCGCLVSGTRRPERKLALKNSVKTWLTTYIRLFEPIIVKSQQLYTITSDVEIQANVLRLLSQLVQLRVNYCGLDGKQVFLDFVLKQFELIEHGQIPDVQSLLPEIIKFFILLSYEKHRPLMSVPKILQLCDGLMASDQPVQTHCIPALRPLVEDVFLSRSLSSNDDKELETQRDVLLSMLLRLVEFSEVMNMLAIILNESKMVDEKEKWKRWSRQVIDALLPLLANDKLRIDTVEEQKAFAKLLAFLSPNVLRPINPLLKLLFSEPSDYNCETSLNRWLSKVTVLFESVLLVKEDALLNRLEEIRPNVNLSSFSPGQSLPLTDPFNVKSFFQTYDPSETAARFILKALSVAADKVNESFASSTILQKKLSLFFVCIYHILKSGTFHRIANSLRKVIGEEPEFLSRICFLFQKLSLSCPFLSCQFSYLLTLLNYCEPAYWSQILTKPSTLSGRLVQVAGVVSLSDYLCDNISDEETLRFLLGTSTEELIAHSHEIPVKDFIVSVRKRKSDWIFLLESISDGKFEQQPPRFVEKLLRVLELSETCHGVALLTLLEKFLRDPRLALSLLACSIACRQVEYLLTLPTEEVVEQLNAETLNKLAHLFYDDKYKRRFSTLWGLLDKLSLKAFQSSVSSLKSDVSVVNSDRLDDVSLREDWYFDLVKKRCCRKYDAGPETLSLLRKLKSERILQIMQSPGFNMKILKRCLSFEHRRLDESKSDDELLNASKQFLHESLREMETLVDSGWSEGLEGKFWETLACLLAFLNLKLSIKEEDKTPKIILKFFRLTLQVLNQELQTNSYRPRNLETGLRFASAVLKCPRITRLFLREEIDDFIDKYHSIVGHFLPFRSHVETSDKLEFLVKAISNADVILPRYFFVCIRDVTMGFCRLPELNSHLLCVPESRDLQDLDSLKSFIVRFSAVGWSGRTQFEEIWVALLSVLGLQGDMPSEDNAFVAQVSSVAIEGITTLLQMTMFDRETNRLLHHGRDSLSMKNVYEKLPVVKCEYSRNESKERRYQFLDNLEISESNHRYVYGLLSVEYLWTAVRQITSEIELYERHCKDLSDMGLDLPSCIYLLTELYNQWINQGSPDIRLLTSTLKSSIVISDLFTDISQFEWLLNFCLRIGENLIPEDIVVLPLVIVGCCKAASIVLPNEETCERIRKLMLRSQSSPCNVSIVEGLLYLLQSYVVCYAVNHTAPPPLGSAFRTDEANFVTNVVDTFLPLALDVVREFKDSKKSTEEDERCRWSLMFYLLQHYHSSLGNIRDEFFSFIFATLSSKNCPGSIVALLTRGCQRLLLTTVVDESFRDRLNKISLDLTSNNSSDIARHGLQLLSVLSFLDKRVKDIRHLVTGQEDPERVMRDMEKINVLFEKLRRSYPKEADVVGNVISYILKDFTASDVLTKIIQEFLSSNQPHQKILARFLFKVFEKAERSLVEDWLVFSLPSFIQGLPVSMSVWTLNCFFVSATTEPWLRALFPLVQSRMRMAETEDKQLLCLSASHFYKQLRDEKQKKSFVETFVQAKNIDVVFNDLLSVLYTL